MEKLVSIVVPTYNRFGFLRCALQSAISQTYKNIEIIVTDDASTVDRQDQDEYMSDILAKHANVKYIQNRRNQGFVKNLNVGLSNASGTYLAILFDDDFLDPLYIESAVEVFERHSDIAFVSMGAYNQLQDGSRSWYVPNVCGKMSKYTYMYHLDYRRHEGTIRWSVSPGNHIFRRHQEHLFRTELYSGWHDRQLKRGSGYDILFILDAFKSYDTCYHLPDQLCTFRSHESSATVMNLDQVIADTKKGIDRYFEEDPCYVQIEIDRYLQNRVLYNYSPRFNDYISGVLGVLQSQNISLYEFVSVFYENGFYNCSLEEVMKRAGTPADPNSYEKHVRAFCKEHLGTIPTLSYLRYMGSAQSGGKPGIEGYKRYLESMLGCQLQGALDLKNMQKAEQDTVESEAYKAANKPTFKNIVRFYWEDLLKRHMKTIALATQSGNIKYARAMMAGTEHCQNDLPYNWKQDYIRYTHCSPKAKTMSGEEMYRSEDFRLLNRMPRSYRLIDYNSYKKTSDRAWSFVPIPLVYKDIVILESLPEQRWMSYIQAIDYGVPLYSKAKDIYVMNEIVGADMCFAIQLSGHLRYYNKLHSSLDHLRQLTKIDTYMFVWNDGMGFKKTTYEESDISSEIQEAVDLFKPVAHSVQKNEDYIKTSLYFSGITFVEYTGCSYPQLKSQYYSVYMANKLRQGSQKNYDLVFKLRMDAELDEEIKQGSIFEMYFAANFKGFIFVSFESDHGHTGGYTGCDLCNKGYYTYRHPTKHYGEHSNDICDFLAICSQDTMDYYANVYKVFEDLYVSYNRQSYEKVHALTKSGKIVEGVNAFLPEKYQHIYRHKLISPEMTQEYRIGQDVPLYPEAFLRIYLKDYPVVSNRHFRFRFNWKTQS